MEPKDFKFLCKTIKEIWKIQKKPIDKNNLKKYSNMKKVFEKSIVSKNFIYKGKKISLKDLDFKKPGDGIKANQLNKVLGKRVKKDIKSNTKLQLSHFHE